MGLSIKIEPIDREIDLALDEHSPAARAKILAEFADGQIRELQQSYRGILGRSPDYIVTVDGRKNARLDSVRPDGVIIAEFEIFSEMLNWIDTQLIQNSPVGSGRDPHAGLYKKSHKLFADNQEVDPTSTMIPAAEQYIFINSLPYARKIEQGVSSQAPDGVYQAVATLAQRRFGNIASIMFAYEASPSGVVVGGRIGNRSENRNPAIIVKPRS